MNERTQYHIIDSGSGGYQFLPNQTIVKNELFVKHNAGFFSCSSIALEDVLVYFNKYKKLPDALDRTHQYMYYKHLPYDNLIPLLFAETDAEIPYVRDVAITGDDVWFQWSDYRLMNFEGLRPFAEKYFMPSAPVLNRVRELEKQHKIDYDNTCGVFYRGNDKIKECGIAPYEAFVGMAREIQAMSLVRNTNDGEERQLRFLIQPDETEFLDYFNRHLPHVGIHPAQWLHMPKDTGASIFMKLPHEQRPEHAMNLLASVIMLSKCRYLITHTGNMSFWACLYRGHMSGVWQWREGEFLK